MEGALDQGFGKMGFAALRYSPNEIVCVVDSKHAGMDTRDVTGIPRSTPIVADIESARAMGAEVLLLGIAPPGGLIPESWYEVLDKAVEIGFCLINGLHDRLAPRYLALPEGQWVWDIRTEPPGIGVGYAEARKLNNTRVLFIGTDMSVGKMTAGLEMWKCALERGVKAEFIATGQVGITVTGKGVPLDCIRLDFASGAIEREVLAAQDADLILVEGQGSLGHPGSSATLPLIRGSQPTHFVMCHRAGMTKNPRIDWLTIPDLSELIKLYEDLAETCGTFIRPKTVGMCLNTGHIKDDEEAAREVQEWEQKIGLPVVDPVRDGTDKIVTALGF